MGRYRYPDNLTPQERFAYDMERKLLERQREEKEQEEIKVQTRKEREELEKERLKQLADVQVDPYDYHGMHLDDYWTREADFARQSLYGPSGVSSAYRPPTNWDYEKDTPKVEYFDLFGEPSLADQDRFESQFNALIKEDIWTNAEIAELNALRDSFYDGAINPNTWRVLQRYSEANVKNRQETKDALEEAGIESYTALPTTLEEAKVAADAAYIEYLEDNKARSRGVPTWIAEGAPSFDTVEDIEWYKNLDKDDVRREALDAQALVMKDFLTRQGGAFDYTDESLGQTFSWGWGNKGGITQLNTGTLIGIPNIDADNYNIGEFGQYGNYSYDNPPPISSEMKAINTTLDVLSVVYPPVAPVFQGIKTTVNTGDIEEGLKSAGKTFLVKEIGAEVSNIAENFVDDLDIDVDFSQVPEPAKEILSDTIGGIASGKSGDEALEGAFVKQIGTAVVDDLDIDEDAVINKVKTTLGMDEDTEIPKFIKNIAKDTTDAWVEGDSASNAFDSSVKSEVKDFVGDVTEEGIKAVAGTTGELLVSAGELAGNVFGSTIDALGPAGDLIESGIGAISNVTSEFEDVVRETGSAIDDTLIQPALGAVAPVVELIEETGRAVDKNITQPTKQIIEETGRAIDKNITQPTIETIDEIVRKIPNPPKIKLPDLEPPDIDLPTVDIDLPEFTPPDIDLPEIDIDLPEIDIDLPSIDIAESEEKEPQQPTQVEGLFDKELFKFDTEIKSTQEMLSPFMNLRRYG